MDPADPMATSELGGGWPRAIPDAVIVTPPVIEKGPPCHPSAGETRPASGKG